MSAIHEGMPLTIESGNVKPFLPKEKYCLMLIEGTGTLTLSYSLDGEKWDEDKKKYTIPEAGHINIETYFVRYAYYKVETTGTLTKARIKYD